ncbi:MAG: hypothetical protein EX263_10690, partial [Flavobacteriaceae bacterium]
MMSIYPNLFIPGAAKSGTSSLHDLLDCHPDICMSVVKEPVFWNSPSFNNAKRMAWYSSLFTDPDAKILGESTTSYMYYPEFIATVRKQFKHTPSFIFILRNPIDRCYSHYWYMKGRKQEVRSFKDSVLEDLNSTFENYGNLPNNYYHFGLYGKWIKRFYEAFGSSQIKIITLEQLATDRVATMNDCFHFLGLSSLNELPDIKSNATKKLKYPKLFHFINKTASGKYRYTKIAKYLISRQRIDGIKKRLKNMSLFKGGNPITYPELSEKDRIWLRSLYLEDVKLLKELTKTDYFEWT